MPAATPAHPFRVVRLDLPLDAATFDGTLRAQSNIALQVHPAAGPDGDAAAWADFGKAHLYHVSSARDDLAPHWFVTAEFLARCPELLAVTSYGAGYDTVDVAACTAAGVLVVNQAGSNAHAVAEHTLGFLLALSKRIADSDKRLRRGEQYARPDGMGHDVEGSVLGLVGIGYIGTRVAQLARAFGVEVIAHDPLLAANEIRARGAEPVDFAELLKRADAISIHCPLDASTRGLFGAAQFAAVKDGALFISTAHGGIHDEAALHAALVAGKLKGAGLDVWEVEPPAASHPLLALDNVLASYHNAGVTVGARKGMATLATAQIIDLANDRRPSRLINPEAWERYLARRASVF